MIFIPKEFELEGAEVIMRPKGKSLTIEPIKKPSLLEFLKNQPKQDEEFPEITDLPPI